MTTRPRGGLRAKLSRGNGGGSGSRHQKGVPTRYDEVESPIRSKVMDADRDSSAPRPEISAHVGSCVIRVRELDPSLKFYGDVFSCNVAVREADMALLVAPNVFHIHLRAPSRRAAAITAGSSICCGPPTPNPICRSSPSGCAPTSLRSSLTPKTE